MSQNSADNNITNSLSNDNAPKRGVYFDSSVFRDDLIENNPFFTKEDDDSASRATGLDSLLAKTLPNSSRPASTSGMNVGSEVLMHASFEKDKNKQQISQFLSEAMREGRDREISTAATAPVVEKKQDYFVLEHDMRYVAKNDTYDGYYEDILPIDDEVVSRERRNRLGTIRLFIIMAIVVIIIIIILIVARFIVELYIGGTPV